MIQVSSAGYLSRKLSLLCINITLSHIKDCKTSATLDLNITDETTFKRYEGRYYHLPKSKKLHLIEEGSFKELKGKDIHVRSPVTCGLDKNSICHTCYGKLAERSRFHIGMVSVCLLTEQFIQMLLSSKHLLQVSTQRIELPDDIARYFEIDRNCLIAKRNIEMVIGEFIIDEDCGYTSIPSLSIKSDEDEDYNDIQFDDIVIFDDFVRDVVDDDKHCSFKEGEEVFNFNVENNEISAPLKKLLRILENEEELNRHTSIESLVLDFIRLLNEANIKSTATGIEMIIRELVRNPENIQERGSKDNFKFLRVPNAIINSNSLAVSLAFERLKSLLETNAFSKKEKSIIDGLF